MLLARVRWLRGPVLSVLGVIYTIPSLSLLVLLIPLFGIGATPAIIALVAYAQLVLVRNIVVGLTGLDPAVIEAARGMGMNSWQRFQPGRTAAGAAADPGGRALGHAVDHCDRHGGCAGGCRRAGDAVADRRDHRRHAQDLAGSIAVALLAFGANVILRVLERRAALASAARAGGWLIGRPRTTFVTGPDLLRGRTCPSSGRSSASRSTWKQHAGVVRGRRCTAQLG